MIDPKDTPRARLLQGVMVQLPTLLSSIPFGIVVGVLGAAAQLGFAKTVSLAIFPMSATVYLVSLQMWKDAAPYLVIVATIMVMNMRFIIYSASVAPWMPNLTWPWRLLTAFALNDQSFAFGMVEFNRHPDRPNKHWHIIGGGLYSLAVWGSCVAIGYVAGSGIPTTWSLDFAGALTFLVLLVQSMNSRAAVIAAAVGGLVAVAAWSMPLKLGIGLAILAGMTAGAIAKRMNI